MKKAILITALAGFILLPLLAMFLLSSRVTAADPEPQRVVVQSDKHKDYLRDDDHDVTLRWDGQHSCFDNGVRMDIDDGSIFLTHEDFRRDEVEITRDYELFVNGERTELTRDQQRTVENYYITTHELIDAAVEIGWEGAKIGAEGAKVGLFAVANLLKMLRSDYDSEDYERDVEKKAAQIERKAAKLERRAVKIEEMADEMEDTLDEMLEDIPALRELNWV